MNIQVGIVGEPDGWSTLLAQEGVPHAVVQGDLTEDSFSAVVVNDSIDDRDIAMLRQYLHLGGAILCSAKSYSAIRRSTRQKRQISYLLPAPGSLFGTAGLVDIRDDVFIPWNANELPAEDGSMTAFVGTFEGGHVIALPVDPSGSIRSETSVRKSFYSPAARLPFEKVSAVGKNGIRRLVKRSLEYLHSSRGIPYVQLWYYPSLAPTVFGFRIDTDGATSGEIEQLYEHLRAKQVPASWFVDVKSQKDFLWRYKQMQGQEVGIHCYEHKNYSDEERNHQNLLRARHAFREANLGAEGYAAPFGHWSPVIGRVVREFRFEYSSEFGWDYDNFPSEPWLGPRDRGVLQVPVHPVSIGSLRRQGYSPESMKSYFRHVVEEKASRREPLLFYHHPKDRNETVLDGLIHEAESAGASFLSFIDWVHFWRARESANLRVRMKDETLVFEGGPMPERVAVRIVRGDGEEAIVVPGEKVRLDSLNWSRPPVASAIPEDVKRVRAFNMRIPLTLAVDSVLSFRRMK